MCAGIVDIKTYFWSPFWPFNTSGRRGGFCIAIASVHFRRGFLMWFFDLIFYQYFRFRCFSKKKIGKLKNEFRKACLSPWWWWNSWRSEYKEVAHFQKWILFFYFFRGAACLAASAASFARFALPPANFWLARAIRICWNTLCFFSSSVMARGYKQKYKILKFTIFRRIPFFLIWMG